jgi:diaminohydroxyphosphoribosylaminopyrimidine deaminase / 5-amino-6-(5-phosphoribosylamino)uracil reductase
LSPADERYLLRTLELAERGRRAAAPNPVVGSVLVRDGEVVGEGFHVRPGTDHAEIAALREAGERARGATAYVSLEPCAHTGRTPPCADALIAAGVVRVVAAAHDPYIEVNGRGFERLRAAGIEVDVADPASPIGLTARRQNAGFRTAVTVGRPHVTYKAAVTLDGHSAARTGDARWISGAESRAFVHALRAAAGAVLVGIGTALADDPALTARDVDPPAERQPLRVVVDRRARLPLASQLVRTVEQGPVLVLVAPDAPADRRTALEAAGVETAAVERLVDGLRLLAARELQTVLCEGGATIAGALLADGLIDRLLLFVAPRILGDPAAPALFGAAFTPAAIADALPVLSLEPLRIGADILLDAWVRDPA